MPANDYLVAADNLLKSAHRLAAVPFFGLRFPPPTNTMSYSLLISTMEYFIVAVTRSSRSFSLRLTERTMAHIWHKSPFGVFSVCYKGDLLHTKR